ncbi:hypothetical protein [Terrabacter sp. C0L_2]|uniref:hypothetical protein n=1 Tax=Terrabacter sp. C0L_2 TaxID=3108389 RepID=UPI002ED1941E|nr:hypothetical protein U5C87_17720 [Terrabacter sp. C0L_2]
MTLDQAITHAAARAAIAMSNGEEQQVAEWTAEVTRLLDQRDGLTAAERTVARLDGYTQEQHRAGIDAARERLAVRRSRKERAREAALRLHCPTFDELAGSPDHSSVRNG